VNFFRKPKKPDNVSVDMAKSRSKRKRQVTTHVWGLNRTQRKQWEFLMQVLRTLGNCFGALFALFALYLTYKIYMHTVVGIE